MAALADARLLGEFGSIRALLNTAFLRPALQHLLGRQNAFSGQALSASRQYNLVSCLERLLLYLQDSDGQRRRLYDPALAMVGDTKRSLGDKKRRETHLRARERDLQGPPLSVDQYRQLHRSLLEALAATPPAVVTATKAANYRKLLSAALLVGMVALRAQVLTGLRLDQTLVTSSGELPSVGQVAAMAADQAVGAVGAAQSASGSSADRPDVDRDVDEPEEARRRESAPTLRRLQLLTEHEERPLFVLQHPRLTPGRAKNSAVDRRPLPAFLSRFVWKYLCVYRPALAAGRSLPPSQAALLVSSQTGQAVGAGVFRHDVRWACRTMQLPEVSPHSFRCARCGPPRL